MAVVVWGRWLLEQGERRRWLVEVQMWVIVVLAAERRMQAAATKIAGSSENLHIHLANAAVAVAAAPAGIPTAGIPVAKGPSVKRIRPRDQGRGN